MYKPREFSSTTDCYHVRISEGSTQKKVLELNKKPSIYLIVVQKIACVRTTLLQEEEYEESHSSINFESQKELSSYMFD